MSQHQTSQHRSSQHRSTVQPAAPATLAARPTRRPGAVRGTVLSRPVVRPGDADLGATTVEYAMVVLAAAAFGGVMAAVLSSGQVRELLTAIIEKALGV